MPCDQPGPFEGTKCWKDKGHDGDHADAGFGYHLSFDGRFAKQACPGCLAESCSTCKVRTNWPDLYGEPAEVKP